MPNPPHLTHATRPMGEPRPLNPSRGSRRSRLFRRNAAGAAIAIVLAVTLVAGCSQDVPFATTPRGWSVLQVSRDGTDGFRVSRKDATISVTARPDNASTNSRMVLWSDDATEHANGTACISFTDGGWPSQEGIALRIHDEDDGSTRLITVMKNVWGRAVEHVNVLLWDTTQISDPVTIDSFEAADQVGKPDDLRPQPWSLCARTEGNTLTSMMWPTADPQPSWDDPGAAHRTTLPPTVPAEGRTGLYAGHLPPGTTMTLTMLTGFPDS